MPLEERLPLDVGHMLGVGVADTVGEREVHPEADTVGDCEALAVEEGEAVSLGEANAEREPLGEALSLEVAQTLGVLVPDTELEIELQEEGEAV